MKFKLFQRKPTESKTGESHGGKRKVAVVTVIAVLSVLVIGFAGVSFHSYIGAQPGFCASCHNMESHVTSYLESSHLDNVHYQANVKCKECHSSYTLIDEAKSVFSYVSGDYAQVFSKRKYDDSMCLQCHISNEFQATQTSILIRNPHASHNTNLRCGNCHMAHSDQVDYCSRCHDNGGQRMIEDINTHTVSSE